MKLNHLILSRNNLHLVISLEEIDGGEALHRHSWNVDFILSRIHLYNSDVTV